MNKEKITVETICRTIVLTMALVNQILTSTGHSVLPIEDTEVTELVTLLFTIGASVWAWWKNNSFTQPAIKADVYMNVLREEEKEEKKNGQ